MPNYVEEVTEDIKQTLEDASCQPILFVGTGLSRRYFDAPSWAGLLEELAKRCSTIPQPLAYYIQKHNNDLIEVGEDFSQLYQTWAWGDGKNQLPAELFSTAQKSAVYIKYITSEIIKNLTPTSIEVLQKPLLIAEINAMKAIQPHALITTNYDELLELIFPDYKPVIGQSILKGAYATIGEIFKIHGCVTDPNSIVLNRSDFNEFAKKKKYISAKLLTYLSEHPVLFIGYSASDPNVQGILADIDEILLPDGALISNIYFLERNEKFNPDSRYATEKLIQVGEHRSIRVKNITANDFKWVFEAFSIGHLDF